MARTEEERRVYVADAVRDEEGWWIIEVPEVDGAMTQAPRLDQVEEMARDVVSLLLEVPADSFDLLVRPQLSEPLASQIGEARELRRQAEQSQLKAAAATAPLIEGLLEAGFRVREIGQLLGITYQRAAQLAARARGPETQKKTKTEMTTTARVQDRTSSRGRVSRSQARRGAPSRRVSRRTKT
jgi:predicted RNase H-like HicB family nuclease